MDKKIDLFYVFMPVGIIIGCYLFFAICVQGANATTLAIKCAEANKIWIANPLTIGLTGECK